MAANLQTGHPLDSVAVVLFQAIDGDLEHLETALGSVAVERLGVGIEDQAFAGLDPIDEFARGAVGRDIAVGVAPISASVILPKV